MNWFNIQKSIFCAKRVFTEFCMLLTTESDLFTVCVYLIGITTETVFILTVLYEVKLHIVFRLIFVCKGLIS